MGLPNFLIIGAARCGTSSLFVNLLKHPQLCGPNLPLTRFSNQKECHFFDKKLGSGYDIKWYKNRFKSVIKDPVYFEATPNYLFVPKVPKLIFGCMPHARFIVMLRNPIDRVWSHYYHWRDKTRHPVNILKNRNTEYVKKGIYWEQLERWFKFFKREQFLIIRSEDFFVDPKMIIAQCFEFVSVEPYDFKKKSIYYWDPKREFLISKRSYPRAPQGIVNWLRKFYAPHNEKLEKLLNRKFGWD